MRIDDTALPTILGAFDECLIGIWFAPLVGSDIMVSLRRQPDASLILRGRRKVFAHGGAPAERQVFQKVFGRGEQQKAEAEILGLCNGAIRELAGIGLAEPGTKVTAMLMRDYPTPEDFGAAFMRTPGMTLRSVHDGKVINPSPGFESNATETPAEASSEVHFDSDKNLAGESDQGKTPPCAETLLRGFVQGAGARIISMKVKSPCWVRAVVDFPGQGTKVVTADVVERPLSDGHSVSFTRAQVDAIREAGSDMHVMFSSQGSDAVAVLTHDVFACADRGGSEESHR